MKYSEAIKPISYLKAHASEVIRDIVDNGKTMVITQNGEAKVVVQDVRVYEQTQESMALLKILAMSNKNVREGKFKPPDQTFDELEKRMKAYSES